MAQRGPITQDLPKVSWVSSLGAYRSFGEHRRLALDVLANGRQGSRVDMLDYALQLRREQQIHRHSLYSGV